MKRLCYLVMILGFLASWTTAFAESKNHNISIIYIAYCYHTERPKHEDTINESPNGVGIIIDKWEALTYTNSFGDQTYLLGREFSTNKKYLSKNIFGRACLHLGFLYGYGDEFVNIMGITLGIAPTIEVGYKHISIESMIIPSIDNTVFACALKYQF